MTSVKFETGATSHAVNELILFTDNTRELAELRDKIYKRVDESDKANYSPGIGKPIPKRFELETGLKMLYDKAVKAYYTEFGQDNSLHIREMTEGQRKEYMALYAQDYENWKKENGFN